MELKEKIWKFRDRTQVYEIIELVDCEGRVVDRKIKECKREPEQKVYRYGKQVIYYKAKAI